MPHLSPQRHKDTKIHTDKSLGGSSCLCGECVCSGWRDTGSGEAFEIVQTHKNFSRLRSFRGSDHVVAIHHIDQLGGAAVADAESALQQGRRGAARVDDDADRIIVERIVTSAFYRIAFLIDFFLAVRQDAIVVGGPPLFAQP